MAKYSENMVSKDRSSYTDCTRYYSRTVPLLLLVCTVNCAILLAIFRQRKTTKPGSLDMSLATSKHLILRADKWGFLSSCFCSQVHHSTTRRVNDIVTAYEEDHVMHVSVADFSVRQK
jgi:hypothetical protein